MQDRAMERSGGVLPAHARETSLEDLRARGKERVRVLSGRRVMELIRAIVDDAVCQAGRAAPASERDRIARDARSRFDRIVRRQTDLEQTVADLRAQLREADLERTRLRADKAFLDVQLERAREGGGQPEAVARLVDEVCRLRETMDEIRRRVCGTGGDGFVEPALETVLDCVAESLRRSEQDLANHLAREFDRVHGRLDDIQRGRPGSTGAVHLET